MGYIQAMPKVYTLQVPLDDDQAAWLRAEAARRRVSMAQVVREQLLILMQQRVHLASAPEKARV